MVEEIELKLALERGAGGRVRRDPLLADARADGTRRLVTTYFDTADLDLMKLDVGLRLRHAGRRWLQTIKTPAGDGGALQRYYELEVELPEGQLDQQRVADEGLRRLLAKRKFAQQLRPVFATDVRRSRWTFRHAGALIELALDQGEIRAGERSLPVSEIELELKGGRPSGLHRAALALAGRLPLRIEFQTKAARGYSLLEGATPRAERARPIRLGREVTPRAAFAAVARACLRQLGGSEGAALQASDTEGVHQMRVALRRLRALIGAYRDEMANDCHAELSRELRWLQRALSPARDWDVFLAYTMPPIRRRLANEPSFDRLVELAEAKREAAYAEVQQTLVSQRYTTLLLRFAFWLDSGRWAAANTEATVLDRSCRRFADRLLAKRHRRLRRLGRRDNLTEGELHRLRLLAKKMRYVADFFRSLYASKAASGYIGALSELQERLGAINDAVVTDSLLGQLGAEREQAAVIERAVALVKGWQARGVETETETFATVWRDFGRRKPFWRKA